MKTKLNLAPLAQQETIPRVLAVVTPRLRRSLSPPLLPAWIELSQLCARVRTWESDVMARLATDPFSSSPSQRVKPLTIYTTYDE